MPAPDDDRPIGDADLLFRDAAPARPMPPEPAPVPSPAGEGPGGYDLLGEDPPARAPVAPVPPVSPVPKRAPTPRPPRAKAEAASVDEPWSRLAEWGPDLVVLGGVAVATAVVVYWTLTSGDLGLAAVLLLIGLSALIVLSYPLVITLERPVRMTPEQAVRDFYGALQHHRPHYRRMWLLLSSAGRVSSSFASFAGFRAYWRRRLAGLRGDRAGRSTPLIFRIEDFKSERSEDKTTASASFRVDVFLRGRVADGPLDSIRVETGLARGPDNQWYLNRGTLPGERL